MFASLLKKKEGKKVVWCKDVPPGGVPKELKTFNRRKSNISKREEREKERELT